MRKLFVMVLVIILMVCGISEAARFRDFPADGVCVGDYVRYRSRPSTNAEIYGRLFDGDEVTVVSQRTVKGQVWYEIYDPEDDDRTAWVSGKYIEPAM